MTITSPSRRHHNPGAWAAGALLVASAALAVDGGWLPVLRHYGVADGRVLEAMASVRRADFLPADQLAHEMEDRPLPIPERQTTSQPSLIARMLEELHLPAGCKVLEVGTGSGYQTALLARICRSAWSVEILAPLADSARARLASLGYRNAHVKTGDGYQGWADEGPFDGIVVSAAAPRIPPPLVTQLKPGGRLVIPVGPEGDQKLFIVTKSADGTTSVAESIGVRFVPLTGPGAEAPR
jgi:protein-L-isoaspartate(D-aspartate) O-methyltransferase